MSPVDWAGPLTGTSFTLGSYEKTQPGFRDEKRPKILWTSFGAKLGKQNKDGENRPIMALTTLLAVSLQLNGLLLMRKIHQVKENDAIRAAFLRKRTYSLRRLCDETARLRHRSFNACAIAKNSSRLPG